MEDEQIFVEATRVKKLSTVDSILNTFAYILSLYVSLFAMVFGISFTAVHSVILISIYGFKYGYSLDNIRWLVSQSAFETADWGSPMAKQDNNIFGMHFPYSRDTYAESGRWNSTEGSYVSQYPNLASSVVDRLLWEKQWITYPITPQMDSELYFDHVYQNYNPSFLDYKETWRSYKENPRIFKRVCYSMLMGLFPIYFLLRNK